MSFGKHASTSLRFATLLAMCLLPLAGGCGSVPATARNGAAADEPASPPDVARDDVQEADPDPSSAADEPAAKPTARRPGDLTKALAAAGDRTYDRTFDDIRFEIEIGEPFDRSMLTPEIEAMVGQRIRIRGYILPTAQQRGIEQFILVRDNQECCFGPGAAIYDCIFVEMEPGKTTEFSVRPVAVTGTFTIDEIIGPDGNHWAIYRIDAEDVRL